MLILQQSQDVVLPNEAYRHTDFCYSFESFDCHYLFSGIASSFVNFSVGTFGYSLEEGVPLYEFERFHLANQSIIVIYSGLKT